MKVVICFADGFEEIEGIAPVDILRRAGIEVLMAGVGSRIIVSARNIRVYMDCLIEEIDDQEIRMLILPGGLLGVQNLEKNSEVIKKLQKFTQQNKYIGAICAAPSLLGKLGLLKGKKATCYPGFEKDLLEADIVDEKIVIDGNIITAKGAGVSLEFGYTLVEILKGKKIAQELREGMIVN